MTAPTRAVVALHGFEDDPAGLASRLQPLADRGLDLIAPRGAVEAPGGPAWFSTGDEGPDEVEVVASLDELDDLLDEITAVRGIDRSQVLLGGFSQGAAVALAFALRDAGESAPLGGVFAVNGWLPHLVRVAYDLAGLAAGGTPVLVVHGVADDVVPVQQGRSAARLLERHGVRVELDELPGGHHLWPEATEALLAWIERLEPPAPGHTGAR